MKGLTHMAFGVAVGTALSAETSAYIPLVIGSLLPDIDTNSMIGKFLPVRFFVKHRTITHSLIAVVTAFMFNKWLGIGYWAHLILDMLTPARVPLFYPWNKRFGIGLIKTGSLAELVLFVLICAFIYQRQLQFVNFADIKLVFRNIGF